LTPNLVLPLSYLSLPVAIKQPNPGHNDGSDDDQRFHGLASGEEGINLLA
jgi:hypothetical protein